jgi:hypothetical protein
MTAKIPYTTFKLTKDLILQPISAFRVQLNCSSVRADRPSQLVILWLDGGDAQIARIYD